MKLYNQEKALGGAFSVIVQPVVEPIDHFTALIVSWRASPINRFAALLTIYLSGIRTQLAKYEALNKRQR